VTQWSPNLTIRPRERRVTIFIFLVWQWALISRRPTMRRHPEPTSVGTRKAHDTHREYSTDRSTPETFNLSISLRNEAWSGGRPRHNTHWLNGGGGPPGAHGRPRRGGSTLELDRWFLSRAISITLDARCDACNRKKGNHVYGAAVRPVIQPHPELASSLPWAELLPHKARRPLSPHPFRLLLFSLQLPLSFHENLSRG